MDSEDLVDEKPVPDVYDGKVVDEAGYAGLADGRPAEQRWFHTALGPHPYTLAIRHSLSGHSFHAIAFFPWTVDSLWELWGGDVPMTDEWRNMISDYAGTIAVGGSGKLYIFRLLNRMKPFILKLPHDPAPIRNVLWALCPDAPYEPLLVFSGSSVITIFNVKRLQVVGRLRGHGGEITAIVGKPMYPQVFCTTSRDFSARIYDLTYTPIQKPNNPHWPPNRDPSLAGAAHGLHMCEPEGNGIGRCIFVLMGGRSGGHRAAVLGAAFHPVLPLLATCGMDRVVKIWRIPAPSQNGDRIAREDKPLFSSGRIHAARVVSVNWISHDVLLSHCAPAIMREDPENTHSPVYFTNGTVALWRWLGLDRFFPPNQRMQTVLRGCASDYQESSSYKLLSMYSLPIIKTEYPYFPVSPHLHVFQSPYHDPLILFTAMNSGKITMMNVTHFEPRKPPPFPLDEDVVEMTQRLRLEDDVVQTRRDRNDNGDDNVVRTRRNGNDNGDDLEDGSNWQMDGDPGPAFRTSALACIRGWEIKVPTTGNAGTVQGDLEICAMGMGGRLLVGVGTNGTISIWQNDEP